MVTAMTSTRTLGSLDRSVSSITQHQMFRSAGPIQSEWCPVESNSIPATQRVLNPLVCRTNLHGNGSKKSNPVTVHAKYIMLKTTNTVWRLIRNSEHAIDRVAAWRKHLLHFCCNETKGDFFFFFAFHSLSEVQLEATGGLGSGVSKASSMSGESGVRTGRTSSAHTPTWTEGTPSFTESSSSGDLGI